MVGIITSSEGAAIKDMEKIISENSPGCKVYEFPAVVQGSEAAGTIVKGIDYFNNREPVDLIILGRGGGSAEDLAPFNDEDLARKIFSSKVPIISAVGHETDFSISDFVADLRAATPTEAAQIVVNRQIEFLENLINQINTLTEFVSDINEKYLNGFVNLLNGLLNYRNEILMKIQYVDNLEQLLKVNMINYMETRKNIVETDIRKLFDVRLKENIKNGYDSLNYKLLNLEKSIKEILSEKKSAYEQSMLKLDYVSPLKILSKGYGIVTKKDDKNMIKSVESIKIGDKLNIKLHKGDFDCEVTEINSDSNISG